MEDVLISEDLDSSRKKTVGMSLLALGALAAGGEGYRRRRQANSSSEWARKGLILVLVLAALTALAAMGARHRRSRASEATVSDNGSAQSDGQVEPIVTSQVAASTS